jgi:hypothetical protein
MVLTGYAQKPHKNSALEIIPEQEEAYTRQANMRISKETDAPLALYKLKYNVHPNTPEVMAREFLFSNAGLLKIEPNLSDIEFTTLRETPGGYHVRFKQNLNGYPVYQGEIVVNINRQNQVVMVMNGYKSKARLTENIPQITPDEARRIANDYLQIRGKINYEDQQTVVFYYNGTTRLVHKITIVPAEFQIGEWEVLVDAMNGEIIRVQDKACYDLPKELVPASGVGRVFDPDPLTRAGALYQAGGQFGDNNDADTDSLVAQIVWRDLLDIEFYNNQYHLEGPYAHIQDFEAPFKGLFSQSDSIWDFTRNPDAFEAANVYYHIDKSMRYINDSLGFNLMPYQYTGGVRVDPHGLNGDDNSHYISATGQVAWGEGGVDDSEDPDVILHELGHGIHDWVTNGGLSQVNGLSEGCGDYWAVSYNRSFGFWTPLDPQYNWVFQWDGHNEFWAGRVTNYSAGYPGGLVGQIHTDGQIWASTLMQIWDDIGRQATDENFLEALSMLNSSSNQEDAAQAFVQADINLHGGANLVAIEYWFTQRGYIINVPVIGPAKPTDATAYSDFQTPTSMQLDWMDPKNLANGDTLLPGEFHVHIERDGIFIDSVAGGSETFTDTGLNDGQEYTYLIYAKLDSIGIISPKVELSWIAGGSPIPNPPEYLSISNQTNQILFSWQNASKNIDGTPMDDFAGIKLYQDSLLVETLIRTGSDTSRLDSLYYANATPGFHSWSLTTYDDESPSNESEPTTTVITPLIAPVGDIFSILGSPNPDLWYNNNTDINDRALNMPSAPYALNLNGKPNGDDFIELYPIDISEFVGSGLVFSYHYQPQGQGNDPEPEDSLQVYFKNSTGDWILVKGHPGSLVQPFQQEIIDLQSILSGNGTFFHDQFQLRIKSTGSPSTFIPNDDWFVDNIYLGVPSPLISASHDSLQFDTTQVDSTKMLELMVNNLGIENLAVSTMLLTNTDFSVTPTQFNLGSGNQQSLQISFTPSQAGLSVGVLWIISNDPLRDTLDIYLSGIGEGVSGIVDIATLPKTFEVHQNFPNPFNPTTTIHYELPQGSEVKLNVYNLLGQKIRTLINTKIEAGRHQIIWDGRNDSGISVASGIYLYHFEAEYYSKVMKMVLMR